MENKTSHRIIFMIGAFALGILIVYLLSLAGDKSMGPLESLIKKAENKVLSIEDDLILSHRTDKRKVKLSSFDQSMNKLKYPKEILLGASDNTELESFETIVNLEDSIHTTFPLIQIYNAWGSKPSEQFPRIAVETIIKLGSIPVITWEPWLNDFDSEEYQGIPVPEKRDKDCLAFISYGTYDKYIIDWAKDLKKVNKPVFVRFAHEMNDPYRYPWGPQNNKPQDFVAAWQHVHMLFDSIGADNAIWIWAPHTAYGYFKEFYPGDEYVDYTGVGVLNFGNAVGWSKWWSFDDLLEKYYTKLDSFNKPIMITEFGSLASGGDRAEWFAEAIGNLPSKYPNVKSLLFFHYSSDKTITNKSVSWYFTEDEETKKAIIKELNNWPDSVKIKPFINGN